MSGGLLRGSQNSSRRSGQPNSFSSSQNRSRIKNDAGIRRQTLRGNKNKGSSSSSSSSSSPAINSSFIPNTKKSNRRKNGKGNSNRGINGGRIISQNSIKGEKGSSFQSSQYSSTTNENINAFKDYVNTAGEIFLKIFFSS